MTKTIGKIEITNGMVKKTKSNMRIIGAKRVKIFHDWVDVEFAVHGIMRSYTGRVMQFGYGMVHCKSSKQIMKTKVSM